MLSLASTARRDDAPSRPSAAVERLAAAARAVSSRLDLGAVLRELVGAAAELADAGYGAVGVLDERGEGLAEFVTVGLSDAEVAAIGRQPTGRGLLGSLVTEGVALRIADLTRHPDSVGFPPNHPPMRTFLGVPIQVDGRPFGRIYLTEKRGGAEFTEEDEALVTLVAAQAAVALQNARLYEQSQRRLIELQALNDVSVALAGQADPATVLRAVARAARTLVAGSPAAAIVVPDGDSLRIAGADGAVQKDIWRLFRCSRRAATRALSDAASPAPGVHSVGHCSFAAVPMAAGERVLGVLLVGLPGEGHLATHLDGLVTLASLAASSLRLAEEFQLTLAGERRTRALFEVARIALGGGPLEEIVVSACERVMVLHKAVAALVLWGDSTRFEVVAALGDVDIPDHISGPEGLPGFDWVPIPGEESQHGWFGVRLRAGDAMDAARRERLEGWAGVVSLAYRAERLRRLRRQLLVAQERSRIAMDLHDGAVQRLFAVGMALDSAALRLGDSDAAASAALATAVDEIDAAIREIRAYVHDLRPSGLAPATLRRLIADNVAMLVAAGIRTELRIDDRALTALQSDAGAEFVHVLSEACGNVARHSRATHAEVSVERRRGRAVLVVSDDGSGFDMAAHTGGHGLRNLRERAARIEADLRVESAPGRGTRVRLEVPV